MPPSATPQDEFDLGIGYMQRKDYALAEETMRNFAQKYPSDPLVADSQYWLGESFFQRQQYRDAAEAFLGVTTKFDKSAKAPDALAAARPVAGGAEGEGSRLRRVRRSDAEISARVERRQSGRRPRAEAREVLNQLSGRSACVPEPACRANAWLRFMLARCPTTTNPPISAPSDAQAPVRGLERAPAIVLAVSGGPDSVALMWLAARWRRALAQRPAAGRGHGRSWLAA